MKQRYLLIAILAVLVMAATTVAGASGDSAQTIADHGGSSKALHHPPPPPMPPEAIEACEGLAENAECSFTMDGETFTGKCRRGPDADMPLACVSRDLPPPPPPRPPAEALDACEDLTEDADCRFTIAGETVVGKCRRGPDATKPLACAPYDMPPPPPPKPHR